MNLLTSQAPLFVGDAVTAHVLVKSIDGSRSIVTFDTSCKDASGKTLLVGSAKVMLEKPKTQGL